MQFAISREALLKPLNLVAGVVERKQTLPVLSNVLLVLENEQLSLTGTDLEVELVGRVNVDRVDDVGEITVPARKLVDICKSLPDGSMIDFVLDGERLQVKSGRSKFSLSTLPATDFPSTDDDSSRLELSLDQSQIKRLIDRTGFAMAQQDVRYYLNGMLFEVVDGELRTVATDGHRLAMCALSSAEIKPSQKEQFIVPRKGVLELSRLLSSDASVVIRFGSHHLHAETEEYSFRSKLVDGKFPDYERVLPRNSNKEVIGDRQALKQAFTRAAILSNEKFGGVRLAFSSGTLQIQANNQDQEEAEETIPVDYDGESLEIGFNVSYILDVLSVLTGDTVKFRLSDPSSSALLEEAEDGDSSYVVMPMRL